MTNDSEKIGEEFGMPYGKVKKAVISVNEGELKDGAHAARLQYKLLLNDAVIKAAVDFSGKRVIIIYNPKGAENAKAKTDIDELTALLKTEGLHVVSKNVKEEDFDYYRGIYLYANDPPRLSEHKPYNMADKEWEKKRDTIDESRKKGEERKLAAFKKWQEGFAKEHPI